MNQLLKPQELKDKDFAEFEAQVMDVFWQAVFGPIVAEIKRILPPAGKKQLDRELVNARNGVTIYLVRHGETDLNKGGCVRGWLDVPLNPVGEEQAAELGRLFADRKIDRIISSDLARAVRTAAPIAEATRAPIEITEDFRPLCFGELQGRPAREVSGDLMNWHDVWKVRPELEIPNGESFKTFQERNLRGLHRVIGASGHGESVAVVCHLRNCLLFLAYATVGHPLQGSDLDLLKRFTQDAGCVSVLHYDMETGTLRIAQMNADPAAPDELSNAAEGPLRDALRSGAIQAVIDQKTGKVIFGYSIGVKPSRLVADALRSYGATFDKRSGTYRIHIKDLPAWVRLEAEGYTIKMRSAHDRIRALLDDLSKNAESLVDRARLGCDQTVSSLDAGWRDSAAAIEVKPELTPAGLQEFSQRLETNAKIPIKNWARESIDRLRKQVDENAIKGFRAESLAKRIRDEYGTTRAKARLIARQETSNFMAAFRASKAKEIGARRYIWKSARDEKTRPDHKKLHGQTFSYDAPPIVDSRTGKRGNPGQDFNCFPGDSNIDLAYDVVKAYRRWYCGELTFFITEDGKTIRSTPNHPILTVGGWKPAKTLNRFDKLIGLRGDIVGIREANVDNKIPMIREIFQAFSQMRNSRRCYGGIEQFHGDGSESHVYIEGATRPLSFWPNSDTFDGIKDILFAASKETTFAFGLLDAPADIRNASYARASILRQCPALFKREAAHSKNVRIGSRPRADSCGEKAYPYVRPFATKSASDGKLALAGYIGHYCRLVGVREVFSKDFRGHVFNLETRGGWYSVEGIITHNCRCVDIPIVEVRA